MSNDKGLLSGSITILIGAVIAIMALVRGPWQAWLLIGVFTLWGRVERDMHHRLLDLHLRRQAVSYTHLDVYKRQVA